jgi:hypothetical protein
MMEGPPMPMAIPIEEIKNEMGNTTVIAAMPNAPTKRPTNIVSTMKLIDMVNMPIAAGTDIFTNNRDMGSTPNSLDRLMLALLSRARVLIMLREFSGSMISWAK